MELPRELIQLFEVSKGRALGDFLPNGAVPDDLVSLLAAARRSGRGAKAPRARLCAYLAGTVPFGSTPGGELWLYVLDDEASPARGVIATLDPASASAAPSKGSRAGAPRVAFRGASTFAFACALDASAALGADASRVNELRTALPSPGVAEQEAVRASFERALTLLDLLTGDDAAVRRAAKKLACRPFEPPHPPPPASVASLANLGGLPGSAPRSAPRSSTRPSARARAVAAKTARAAKTAAAATARKKHGASAKLDRTMPLALGPLVEAFFRTEAAELDVMVVAQRASSDAVVREAATLLTEALVTTRKPRTALARDLARRRELALRTARAQVKPAKPTSAERAQRTRHIVSLVDACPPGTEPLATTEAREEALVALAEHGDRSAVPSLVARVVTGDVGAVDMLGALRDPSAVAPLVDVLQREPQRYRLLEAAVVRTLAALDAGNTTHTLRALLAANPMPSWREGIERGVLVKELVTALGTLRDELAGPALIEVLSSTSQEYRAILPQAAWALGRIRHLPALTTLERLLASPKEPPTCEAIWAVGSIGAAHPSARVRAAALLDALTGLEPGAELVRLTALASVHGHSGEGPSDSELRRALERALWEPAFRQEESSRRRTWALRSLEELAAIRPGSDEYFLGHEAVRYFVTRDDHRVRRAAEDAFAAWRIPVPATRRYYVFALDALDARGGVATLHEALRDPLGVFRHNIATRLAERAHASSVRPLAEATARLFAEPPTSTYEYDDAPSHLVAFVRALAKLNQPEGNDVLIDGLRSGNHQVRAVVAENAPDDARFVPELMAMLGDPRSFLRSRAEKSLAALGVRTRGSDRPTRLAPL